MIWLLLSGYFVIAAVFYNTAPQVIENTITNAENAEEIEFTKKYGKILMVGISILWPITIAYAILIIAASLLQKK